MSNHIPATAYCTHLQRWIISLKDTIPPFYGYCFSTPFRFRITNVFIPNNLSSSDDTAVSSFPSIQIEMNTHPDICTATYSVEQHMFIGRFDTIPLPHIQIPLQGRFPSFQTLCDTFGEKKEHEENDIEVVIEQLKKEMFQSCQSSSPLSPPSPPPQLLLVSNNSDSSDDMNLNQLLYARQQYSDHMITFLLSLKNKNKPLTMKMSGKNTSFMITDIISSTSSVKRAFPIIKIRICSENVLLSCEYQPSAHRFVPYCKNECSIYWDLQGLFPSFSFIKHQLPTSTDFSTIWNNAMQQINNSQCDHVVITTTPNDSSDGFQISEDCSSHTCYKCNSSNCREVKYLCWRSNLLTWLKQCIKQQTQFVTSSDPSSFIKISTIVEDLKNIAPIIYVQLFVPTTGEITSRIVMTYRSHQHIYAPLDDDHVIMERIGMIELSTCGFPSWYYDIDNSIDCYQAFSPPSSPRPHAPCKQHKRGYYSSYDDDIINPLLLAPKKKKNKYYYY